MKKLFLLNTLLIIGYCNIANSSACSRLTEQSQVPSDTPPSQSPTTSSLPPDDEMWSRNVSQEICTRPHSKKHGDHNRSLTVFGQNQKESIIQYSGKDVTVSGLIAAHLLSLTRQGLINHNESYKILSIKGKQLPGGTSAASIGSVRITPVRN